MPDRTKLKMQHPSICLQDIGHDGCSSDLHTTTQKTGMPPDVKLRSAGNGLDQMMFRAMPSQDIGCGLLIWNNALGL